MAENPTIEQAAEGSEPCAGCGHPLAGDQRYCLNCGRRHGEPRIDYAPHVAAERDGGVAAPVAPVVSAAAPAPQREPSPVFAVVGIALLGLMLLVGVLLGRGDGDGSDVAATPTVVTVGEESSQVADAGAGAGAGNSADESGSVDVKTADKGGGGNDGGISSGPGEEGSTDNPALASRDELKELEEASPEDYAEASKNLPDTIAIPGKPPPTDNEAPGGGTDAQVIE